MNNRFHSFFTKTIPWIFLLLAGIAFLLLADESRTPISTTGKHMSLAAGSLDESDAVITQDSGFSGSFLTGPGYLLDKGSYALGVAYAADSDKNRLLIYDNGVLIQNVPLNPAYTYQEFPFALTASSPDLTYAFFYGGSGYLRIQSVSLIPGQSFYKDTGFLIVLLLSLFLAAGIWRIFRGGQAIPAKTGYTAFFLIGIGLLASLPYLKTGLDWAVDLCYHLIRIEGVKDGLLAGQFPVIIYPKAMHGNGYLNAMYPSAFLYLPAFLRLLGVSMADSFKFLIIVFHFATAFLTYHLAKTVGGDTRAALLASLLYTCAPYRFTNIYARGAVGEFLAMTFFPLVLAGLYHILIGDKAKWGYLALGMTGLLQSHVLSAVLGSFLCAVLCILYLKPLLTEGRIVSLLKAAALSLLWNLGFLIPFLDFYQKENLWMDALNLGSYQEYTLNISGLLGLQTTGDYHLLTLGIPLAVCAVLTAGYLLFERGRSERDSYISCLYALGIFFTFLMISFFPAWKMMTLPWMKQALGTIQFAWRLLGPVSLLFAVTGSVCLTRSGFLRPYQNALLAALGIVCILSAARFRDEDFGFYSDRDYSIGHESKVIGIPKGGNTVVYPYEWRLKNTLDSAMITDTAVSDASQVTILSQEREGVATILRYTCRRNGQYIEIPVLFYMGYQAEDETGSPLELTTGTNNRIRIWLPAPDGAEHSVTVAYKMPLLYRLAAWLSVLTMVLFLFCVYRRSRKREPQTKSHR